MTRRPSGNELAILSKPPLLITNPPMNLRPCTKPLGQFQLDKSSVEVEAIRQLSEDAELETLDRMLASLESRRDKALRCIGEYRESLARQLRESADRMIDGKGVLRLEHASGKRSTAAWPWQANGKLLRINATPARAPVPDPGLAGKGRAATPIATA